jgi:hypothetical protein
MSYFFSDFDSINEDALTQLQANQVPEGKANEYKLTLELKDSKSQTTLLKKITAFANGSGGDLLYGIEAKDGLPVGIPGLSALNFDATVRQLQNLSRSHVEPRLFGVRYRSVPLANRNAMPVIGVPRFQLVRSKSGSSDRSGLGFRLAGAGSAVVMRWR